MDYKDLIGQKRTLHNRPTIDEYEKALGFEFAALVEAAKVAAGSDTGSHPASPQPEPLKQPGGTRPEAPQQPGGAEPEFSPGSNEPTRDPVAKPRKRHKILPVLAAVLIVIIGWPYLVKYLVAPIIQGAQSGVDSTVQQITDSTVQQTSNSPGTAGASSTDTPAASGKTSDSGQDNSQSSANASAGKTSESSSQQTDGPVVLIDIGSLTPEELLRLGDESLFSDIPDLAAAANYYKEAAEQGNATAQLLICDMYLSGIGGEKDLPTAMRYFHLAEKQNFDGVLEYLNSMQESAVQLLFGDEQLRCLAAGRFYLQGLMYACGAGTKQDYETAVSFYEQAADAGEGRAQIILLLLYFRGIEVEQDREKAEKYRDTALNNEMSLHEALRNENQAYFIAETIADGIGLEIMPEWKGRVSIPGVNANFWSFNSTLAMECLEATGIVAPEFSKTEEEELEAEGMQQDFLDTLRVLSDEGDGFASLALAEIYELGIIDSLGEDTAEAEEYYSLAIQQGSGEVIREAVSRMGVLNPTHAILLTQSALERAAKQGDVVAIQGLYERSVLAGLSGNVTAEYLSRLEEAGTMYSLYYLGQYYQQGTGVEKDFNEAAAYYRRSAKLGLPQEIFDALNAQLDSVEPVQGLWMTVSSVGDIYYFHNNDCNIYSRSAEAIENNTMDYTLSETRTFRIEELNDEKWGKGIKVVFDGRDTQYWLFDTDPDLLECHWGTDGYSGSGSLIRQEDLTIDDIK